MKEDANHEHVSKIIDDLEPGTMVVKYFLVAEGMDVEGRRSLYTVSNPDATLWDSTMLLYFALKDEEAKIFKRRMEQ